MNDVANNPLRKVTAGLQYLLFQSGPLATNGICAGGFARSDQRLERPDIQLNFSLWSFAERTRKGVYPHPFPGFTVSAVHLRPDARGEVRVKSADPLAAPAIRFNFLKTRYDLQALTAGMRLARKIVDQPALADYVADELIPGKEVSTDAEFEAAIRKNAISNLHPVGTCRMGGDEAWRCSIRGSRCAGSGICASSTPRSCRSVPAGNTNAPSIMIGEKASEMILEDARAKA